MTAPAGYAAVAEAAGDALEGAPPEHILSWALDAFWPRFALTSSLADAVLIDMVSRLSDAVPVLFVDTGYHFAQTLGTRDAVAARYDVRLLQVVPVSSVAEQDVLHGPRLYERDPDLCCRLRKVMPLDERLGSYVAWASGIRREEARTRRTVRVVDWDERRRLVKVNPLAAWTQSDVERYIEEHQVLTNPLLGAGYRSVGCAPCTQPVTDGDDPRAGRWAGTGKVECGLHS